MFHYLDNDRVPKSPNGSESYFGHLKVTWPFIVDSLQNTERTSFNGICILRTLRVRVFFRP